MCLGPVMKSVSEVKLSPTGGFICLPAASRSASDLGFGDELAPAALSAFCYGSNRKFDSYHRHTVYQETPS